MGELRSEPRISVEELTTVVQTLCAREYELQTTIGGDSQRRGKWRSAGVTLTDEELYAAAARRAFAGQVVTLVKPAKEGSESVSLSIWRGGTRLVVRSTAKQLGTLPPNQIPYARTAEKKEGIWTIKPTQLGVFNDV